MFWIVGRRASSITQTLNEYVGWDELDVTFKAFYHIEFTKIHIRNKIARAYRRCLVLNSTMAFGYHVECGFGERNFPARVALPKIYSLGDMHCQG